MVNLTEDLLGAFFWGIVIFQWRYVSCSKLFDHFSITRVHAACTRLVQGPWVVLWLIWGPCNLHKVFNKIISEVQGSEGAD